MAFDEEKHIQALVNLYRQGFINVLNTLFQKQAKGQYTVFAKDQLKNILDILAQLDAESAKWIQQVIPQIYQENYTRVLAFINKMGLQRRIKPNFAQVHQRAIDVIAQNMYDNLRQATQYAGRRIQDEFRRAGIDTMGEKYTEGLTWRETAQRLQQRLLSEGLTGFKDKLGREWRLDSYAQMVARTTSREIATVATINTCQEADIDLVQISSHWPTCEICAPLQGKVFSISGNDKRYPKLEEEYTPPIHPNCRHVTTPYVREFDPEAEKTQRHSNTPLDKDTRTEAEKQAYKEAMDKAAIARNRKRAREVLYSDAPLIEKIKAAKRLSNTYKKSGTKPVGRDASIINQYKQHIDSLKLGNVIDINEKTGIITVEGKTLPRKAFENAVIDLKNEKYGLVRRRFFDERGIVKLDIDMTDHGAPKAHPIVPHAHDWKDIKNRDRKGRPLTDAEFEMIKDIWRDKNG